MYLSELMATWGFEHVEEALYRLYPEQVRNAAGYLKAWDKLMDTEAAPADFAIHLDEMVDETDTPPITWVKVGGIYTTADEIKRGWQGFYADSGLEVPEDGFPSDSLRFCIGFQPWAAWLGAEISKETLADFPQVEILAHILYEMSYYSFDDTANDSPAFKAMFEDINPAELAEIELAEVEEALDHGLSDDAKEFLEELTDDLEDE